MVTPPPRTPIRYAFKALIPQQFYCGSDGAGAACAQLTNVPTPVPIMVNGTSVGVRISLGSIDRYMQVSSKYEVFYEKQWESLGYLAIFVLVFQMMAFIGTRYVRHIVR